MIRVSINYNNIVHVLFIRIRQMSDLSILK